MVSALACHAMDLGSNPALSDDFFNYRIYQGHYRKTITVSNKCPRYPKKIYPPNDMSHLLVSSGVCLTNGQVFK